MYPALLMPPSPTLNCCTNENPQGFAGRLQLAQPNIYACSAINGPAPTTAVAAAAAAAAAAKDAAGELNFGGATPPNRAHGGVSRGMPLAVSRKPPSGEILATASTTAAATAAATAGEEELPSAVLISRSEIDVAGGCTFETKVREWRAKRRFGSLF